MCPALPGLGPSAKYWGLRLSIRTFGHVMGPSALISPLALSTQALYLYRLGDFRVTYQAPQSCCVNVKSKKSCQFNDPPGHMQCCQMILLCFSVVEYFVLAQESFFRTYRRIDTTCENNDHLLARAWWIQKAYIQLIFYKTS